MNEHEICGDLELLAQFYGYEVVRSEEFNVFRLKNDLSLDYNHQLFIYNIPTTFTEEKLLLFLLKSKNLRKLKIVKVQSETFAFAEFSTENRVEYIRELFSNYEDRYCKITARKCRLITTIYIDFFESCDTELGLELLINGDDLFKNYPEVIVDVKYSAMFRNEPAVVYEWKKSEDSRRTRPEITILNTLEARNLQMF